MLRLTKQKRLLTAMVEKCTSFFTADDLHELVKEHALVKESTISLATVYRFLNMLENTGEIHSFMCNNKKIYSHNKTNHAHFHCEICGKREHITLRNVDFLGKVIQGKVCHFQVDVTGICKECSG